MYLQFTTLASLKILSLTFSHCSTPIAIPSTQQCDNFFLRSPSTSLLLCNPIFEGEKQEETLGRKKKEKAEIFNGTKLNFVSTKKNREGGYKEGRKGL